MRIGAARRWRWAAATAMAAVAAGLIAPAQVQAQTDGGGRPKTHSNVHTVKGHQLKARPRKTGPATKGSHVPVRAAWPKPGAADVSVSARPTKAGGLPIWLNAKKPGGAVHVRLLDQGTAAKAGVDGPVFALSGSAGQVGVRLDYGAFGQAYGGSYGSRLTLKQLPACALTTPDQPRCRTATPLTTKNDARAHTLTATAGAQTLLAATTGTSGATTDFKATSLAASATWKTSLNTGDFSWAYPMRVPSVPGGLAPQVQVSYSSSSVDGRTTNTNNQTSWVGEGFDLWPGYIERNYKACADDGAPKDEFGDDPGDQCWGYDNATLTWNGKGGELIPDGDGKWHIKDDDGSRIEKLTGADNGDDNGEYWRLTTSDGTQYYFGRNHLPGWASGKPETKSAWDVPVYGDDDTEPCHKSTFADSWCRQAWRWNLDYVVDPRGNAIAYYYTPETNYYGRDLKPEDETSYERGGYLDHIEYGLRKDDLFAAAPARVDFDTQERCIRTTAADCDESNIGTHPEYWEDTPWDLHCTSGTECKDDHGSIAPTFWSRKRLTKVTTQVIKPDGSGYRDVDSWSLAHDWGLADIDRDLLLTSITHTGDPSGTSPVMLPPTTFTYGDAMPNRVDKLYDDIPPFLRYRLGSVNDESGGIIDVNYSAQDCGPGDLPTPETNTRRCYPQYWQPAGHDDPIRDWFNKYVVTQVVLTDRTGGSPDQVTNYDYQGGAAWHYDDDDGLTKEKYKTWSQWRGYGTVVETSGGWNDMRSQTDHQFFRGMDGDRLNTGGGTKSVTIADGEGGTYPDTDPRQGFELKTAGHFSPNAAVAAKTINTVWTHETAKRVRSWGTTTANLTGTASTRTLTALDGGTWRETLVKNTFDDTAGLPTKVEDLGDTSTAADDQCTTTAYARDTGTWMLNYPSEVRTVALPCATTPDDLSEQLISGARMSYDNGAFGDAPTTGEATKVEKAGSASGTTASYYTTAATAYDSYGRVHTLTDALGQTTTTTYTDTRGLNTGQQITGPPVQAGVATSALSTSEVLDPAWSVPTSQTDEGGKITNLGHDGLGRLTKVWLADRTTAQTPNLEYAYRVVDGAPASVATKTLNNDGTQQTSYELYDGWLRSRQTQASGPDGRLISDTFYGVQGKPERTFATYTASGAPDNTALFGVDQQGAVESQTHYTYDGLGRVTLEQVLSGNGDGTELWHTTTQYGGDRVTVTPPAGGIPTTTISDARGRTTELRQLKPTGYVSTSYAYTPGGELASATGPDGKTWTYGYDLRGRKVSEDDPDKGAATYGYDDLDRLTSATDARGKKIVTTYDPTGRETGVYEDSTSGTQLAGWVYDSVRKGQPTSETSYSGGNAYTTSYSLYDNLNRPLRTTYAVPSAEGALAGNYVFGTAYNLDGTTRSMSYASGGGLAAETVTTSYDTWHRATKLDGNLGTYVTKSDYDPVGRPLQYQLSSGGKNAWLTYGYEYGTQRLHESRTDREDVAGVDRDSVYGYDDAGNVTSIADTSRNGTDKQCFRYDDLLRLTDAWSQSGGTCPADPSSAVVGGPAGYRASYSYDVAGNRVAETEYGSGGAVLDARVYGYAGDPGVAPAITGHELGAVTQTGANAHTESYTYDKTGNTTSRTISGSTQTLDWDAEGRLSEVSSAAGDTNYVYDTDGDQLIRRDPGGTTLYLPGTELRLNTASSTPTCTRYYSHAGSVVAMRTTTGVQFLSGDAQGTAQQQINGSTQALSQRWFDPFGGARGAPAGTWSGEKGFVGGTQEPDGLTRLGAREYDPDTGRFISVDPMFDPSDPQSWNGYAYADNNPATLSDPDGLMHDCPSGAGGCGNTGNMGGGNGDGDPDYSPSGNNCSAFYTCGGHYNPAPPRMPLGVRTAAAKNWDIIAMAIQRVSQRTQYRDIMDRIWECADGPVNTARCGGLDSMETVNFGNAVCAQAGITCSGPDTGGFAYTMSHSDGMLAGGRDGNGFFDGHGLHDLAGKPKPTPQKPKTCGVNSFVQGTLVLLANGDRKAIEDVKVGDKVLATDPETGKTQPEPVIAAFGGTDYDRLVQVTVDTDGKHGHRTGLITSTEHHKFWDPARHAWTRADHLSANGRLRTPDGKTARIVRIVYLPGHPVVRDLTIARVHTFYVQVGSTPVLVHNEDDGGPIDLNGKSHTSWQRGPYRIDIEARNGTKQMHFQQQIKGVRSSQAPKYQYDPATGDFKGMPKSLKRDLAKNYPDYKKGFEKAVATFDRVIGVCG